MQISLPITQLPELFGLGATIGKIKTACGQHPFFVGFFLMLATTALWALAFVAPLSLPEASAIEIALGRFIVYGLLSLGILGVGRLIRLPRGMLGRAALYALTGNIVYYLLLVFGIQLADATLAVLIIGMLPVTVSIFGNIGRDTAILRRLALPLTIFAAGIITFNLAKTNFLQDTSDFSVPGILCVCASLVMWTWYAINNARFLQTTREITASEWSSVIGAVSLVIALVALPLSWGFGLARNPGDLSLPELWDIALWSVILGGGTTWLGTVLFNTASKLLSTSLLGQLIVFEAVFGTLYVFVFAGQSPSVLEFFGISIALLAVWLSVRRV